jgi:DNA-binding MltR family transcriptional regulator
MASASKKFFKQLPSDNEMRDVLFGLLKANDHTVALTGMAYLDHALKALLRVNFRDLTDKEDNRLFDGAANGILGTISAKIRIAYAMKLIDPIIYDDLLLLNDIRNTFAHTLHQVDFDNQHIKEDCTKLKHGNKSVGLRVSRNKLQGKLHLHNDRHIHRHSQKGSKDRRGQTQSGGDPEELGHPPPPP